MEKNRTEFHSSTVSYNLSFSFVVLRLKQLERGENIDKCSRFKLRSETRLQKKNTEGESMERKHSKIVYHV